MRRSLSDALWVTGGCGVGVLILGTAFFVTRGFGGTTVFFTGGRTIFFGATFFGIALIVGLTGAGVRAVVPPLRPSIMILPS